MSQEYYNYYNQPESPQEPKKDSDNGEKHKGKGKGKLVATIVCSVLAGAIITTAGLSAAFDIDLFNRPISGKRSAAQTTAESMAYSGEAGKNGDAAQATPAPSANPLPTLGGEAPSYISQSAGIVEVAEEIVPTIVRINVTVQQTNAYGQQSVAEGGGSGIVVSSDGYIVTNNHVVENATDIKVIFESNEEEEVTATVVGTDPTMDLAVIKVDKKGLQVAPLGTNSELKVGESVIAVGNPLGSLGGSVTAGIISAIDRSLNIDGSTVSMIQTDAAINPGNSGGALVNMRGEVIGINSIKTVSAGTDDYGNVISAEGIGFAIPIKTAMPIVEQLIQYGKVDRPGIGITGATVSLEQAQKWDTPRGVIIKDVTAGGAADKAGVKSNDIITAIDGEKISDMEALSEKIKAKKIGDKISLTIWRETGEVTADVTIADMNEMNKAAAAAAKQQTPSQIQGNDIPGLENFPWSEFFK